MGTRGTLMRAVGAFLLTAVLFTAAIVIAHNLDIPDPVSRILPVSRYDPPETVGSEHASESVALSTDDAEGTPLTPDDTLPEVTAVPTPADADDRPFGEEGSDTEHAVGLSDDDGGHTAADADPAEPEPKPDDSETADDRPPGQSGTRPPGQSGTRPTKQSGTRPTASSSSEPATETLAPHTQSLVGPPAANQNGKREGKRSWWDLLGRDGDPQPKKGRPWWDLFGTKDRLLWWGSDLTA